MPEFTSHVSGTATGANSDHVAIDLYHLAYLIALIAGSFFFFFGRNHAYAEWKNFSSLGI